MAGIGFLGGGVILRNRSDDIKGLTTAAMVWLTAALGVACALGSLQLAMTATALSLLIVIGGKPLERVAERVAGRKKPGSDSGNPPPQ